MFLPRLARAALVPIMVALALLSSTAPASATEGSEQPVRLSAKPLGQPGSFFDLTLEPDQERRLSIALGNHAEHTVAARTYAADVTTIINGGFGPNLRDQGATGATTWLDYPTEVVQLPPGNATTRSFTVRVPPGTPPGEYITSVILENDQPVAGSGGVTLNQVVRQAVAVAIRVPGELVPALEIGAARHTEVAHRSVVAVEVANPGTARLTPAGEISVKDSTGRLVSQAPVSMDSFYSGTNTLVEIALAKALRPGAYTVDLTLVDADRGAKAVATGLPLTVEAPSATSDAGSVGSQLVQVLQSDPTGAPVWAIALSAVLLALGAAGAVLAWRRVRARTAPPNA
jgi:methionine-rich copper-binding protein CopC